MQEVIVPHQDLIHVFVGRRREPTPFKVEGLHHFGQVTRKAQVQPGGFAVAELLHDRMSGFDLVHIERRCTGEPEHNQFRAGKAIMAAISEQNIIAERV